MSRLLFKKYLDTVEKIDRKYPKNSHLAEQKHPLEEKFPELHAQYGDIWFKPNDYPDFTPFTVYEAKITDLTGVHYKDVTKANAATGIKELPKKYTWHHIEDGMIMQAIPTDLHKAIKYTDSASNLRNRE